ncbi:MAG TPA: hypothetical protein PLS03_02640 [Terrimicrobiaceae bacterium]|nr:hypothetical protein [Terrimicrobiaceae bacterium]
MDALKKVFLLVPALCLGLGSLCAQEASPTPGQLRRGIWTAELPGGTYVVRLSAITSVSIHEYVVDGSARVSEVNVGTIGSELVRFYFIEPNIPQTPNGIGQSAVELAKDRAKEVISRAGADDVWQKVAKNYPTTTHARTVEYRLADKETLKKLFESVQDSWVNNRAATFKP